jgi:mono/diheme cytochrome c family protein
MNIDKAVVILVTASALAFMSLARAQDDRVARLARGEQVFAEWCAPCHADGPGMPGTQALQVKYDGALPAALLERSDLTPELISFYVRNGISVMPHFRKTEIGDDDLTALAAYIADEAAE